MLRPILSALLLGLVAGAVTAVTLALMHAVETALWHGNVSPLRIAVTIMIGGLLVALLRIRMPDETFDTQLEDSREGRQTPLTKAALLAALGIVSVGFGGALGPEAGILAVAAELSGLVAARIARDVNEARLISQIGAAGALGGLYGSPLGGASYVDDRPGAPWILLVLAAMSGLVGMYLAGTVLPEGPGLTIPLPPAPDFGALFLLPAVLGGAAGALVGAVYAGALRGLGAGLAALSGDVRVRVLIGTAIYALMAAVWPILRFNGQHEMAVLAQSGTDLGAGYLAALAVLKAIALALCLASAWLGGPIMPLAMAGAAAGAALAAAFPGLDLGVASAAAVAACCTVGLQKPIVVLLVLIFMASHTALIPMVIGVLLGWFVAQMLPAPPAH